MSVIINGDSGITDVNGTAAAPAITGTDTDTGLYFGTNTLGLSTGGTAAVTVDSSQNVGIGTASPAYKLDVNGTINTNTDLINTGGRLSLYRADGASYIDWSSGQALAFRTETSAGGAGATERMRIDSTGYVTNAVNGLGNGLHQAYQYYRLNSGYAGSNATGAQSVFGVGVTLVGSTVYEFEIQFAMSKTAGATSHTIGLGFGGTATVNNIGYFSVGTFQNTLTGNAGLTSAGGNYVTTVSNTTQTTSQATANTVLMMILKGTVSINAGGTFIPQYTLSAAPGGAYTTQIGSYIKISPLSASGANTNIGSWA